MAREIERKFLVTGDGWRRQAFSLAFRQGYLSTTKERTVRVRVVGDHATLTVKGITIGAIRSEFEYPIPVADGQAMLDRLCEKPIIEKTRHVVEFGGNTWEVDEFGGANAGLIVAEIELEQEDQEFERPPWLGPEVTGDPRYYNANLIAHPFSRW